MSYAIPVINLPAAPTPAEAYPDYYVRDPATGQSVSRTLARSMGDMTTYGGADPAAAAIARSYPAGVKSANYTWLILAGLGLVAMVFLMESGGGSVRRRRR